MYTRLALALTQPDLGLSDPLALPAFRLVAEVAILDAETSIRQAASLFATDGIHVLPVAAGHHLIGTLYETDLLEAMAAGAHPDDSIRPWYKERPTADPEISGAAVLRMLTELGLPGVIVADTERRPLGAITPSRLLEPPAFPSRPQQVGGMATPLGVYLTSGRISGGAPPLGLILTGVTMGLFFILGAHLALLIVNKVAGADKVWGLFDGLTLLFFLALLRFSPLAKIHSGEHMAVNAIESGENITDEVVARMSRIHPRCGTNLAMALTLFVTIFNLPYPPDQEARLLLAIIGTLALWRPLGTFAQRFITTAPPKAKHIHLGVIAARDLLAKHENQYIPAPSVFTRIKQSGLIHIMLGATLIQLLVIGIYEVLRLPDVWRVISLV